MLDRKEFKKLLIEWKKNFVISEKTIPQPQNISDLGKGGEKGIVKKSRQLNGWLTYFTTWTGNSPYNLDKYSEDSEEYDKMWDEGRENELQYSAIDINDPSSRFSMEFVPLAKKLGFQIVSSGKDVSDEKYSHGFTVIRMKPKKGKEKELFELFSYFSSKEAQKIVDSGCCNDDMPLFIVPFDYDASLRIPGVFKYSSKAFTNIDQETERYIMHWMIHDMWHLIPEWFDGDRFTNIAGLQGTDFKDFESKKFSSDFSDAISFTTASYMTDDQKAVIGLNKEDDLMSISEELSNFFNESKFSRDKFGVEVSAEDVGPSVFAYVLMNVESHNDIDNEMSELSEEAKNFVKKVFDEAPGFWNKICSYFTNEIVLFIK